MDVTTMCFCLQVTRSLQVRIQLKKKNNNFSNFIFELETMLHHGKDNAVHQFFNTLYLQPNTLLTKHTQNNKKHTSQ